MTVALTPRAAAAHLGHGGGSVDHWGQWSPTAGVFVIAAVAVVAYAAGWLRLRRRGRRDLAGVPRAIAFGLGAGVVVLALVSPLDDLGHHYLLSAHMVQHALIGDVGPLLMVLGASGPLALFVVPTALLRRLSGRRTRRVLRVLGRPSTAFVAWSLATGGWYLPAAYDFALASTWGHWTMQISIILTGVGVWAHIVGTVPHMRMSHARRAGYAVGLLGAGMVVSEFLFLNEPLYAIYRDQPERVFGMSPSADQIRASLLMTAEQMITLLMAATLLMWTHVDRAVSERDAPGGSEEPPAAIAPSPPGLRS